MTDRHEHDDGIIPRYIGLASSSSGKILHQTRRNVLNDIYIIGEKRRRHIGRIDVWYRITTNRIGLTKFRPTRYTSVACQQYTADSRPLDGTSVPLQATLSPCYTSRFPTPTTGLCNMDFTLAASELCGFASWLNIDSGHDK